MVQRYEMITLRGGEGYLTKSDEGRLVSYEDYEKLIAQLEAAQQELSAANEKHGWVKRSHQMPDPNQQRRVCVFTPNDAADLRYRLVPTSLFKAVCSSATHWYYVNDPVDGE